MNYKFITVLALVGLLAIGCNKSQNNSRNTGETQNSQNSANNQQVQNSNTPAQSNDAGNLQDKTTLNKTSSTSPGATYSSGESGTDFGGNIQVWEVDMTAHGFAPGNITINKGDYIQFQNKDTQSHQPAAGPLPSIGYLAGFVSKTPVQPGKYFRYQFTKSGTFNYFDELNTSSKGMVTVQ